jgi:iron complex outermembrane receptor protein
MIHYISLSSRKAVVTFRRWGRKGYSVFSSLHKIVQIAVLSTIYLIFSLPASADEVFLLQSSDTIRPIQEIEMDEVVISAQRVPVSFSQAARIVRVISKNQLTGAPVHDLQDLLKFVPNMDVRQRSGNGVQSDISLRGSSFDQVLILLNGIPQNDPQTGHHNLNLPVSFDAIDRIEILEGPASRLYGPNAFSGAINIITGKSSSDSFTGRLSGGQYGFFEGSVFQSVKTGNLSNTISGGYKRSDGALKNTDFKISNLYYNGNLQLRSGKINFQGGYSVRGFGANDFYTPVYPTQYEHIKTIFSSAGITSDGTFHLTSSFYWRRNQDRFELFREFNSAPAWYKMHNYHLTDTYGTILNGWIDTGSGKLAYGTDLRNENIWSTVLGRELNQPVNVPGESGIWFNHADSRTNISLYSEYSHHFGSFDISGGLMANRNSSQGRKWEIFPGIDISWRISALLKMYASVNKSLRIPTFTDLYYKSATNIGNPYLLPEEAQSYETGIKYNNPWISSHLSLFLRLGQNMIDWVRQPEETIWYAKNITTLNTKGIAMSARMEPSRLFEKDMFIRSLDISYGYLIQNKESGTYISKYLLDYLKHKIDISLSHSLTKHLSATWLISYQDRNGTFTLWEENHYGAEKEYVPIWLIDSKIIWTNRQFTIFLEASNLLNKSYYDYGNVENPGIWVKAGTAIKLGN